MILIKDGILNNKKVDILIIDNKITTIGNLDENQIKKLLKSDFDIINAKDKYIIPGFIDNHVHITGGGGESGFESRVPEISLSDISKYGVTSLVGVLGTDSITRTVENLVAKTKALNNEGLTVFCLTGAYEYPSPTITGSVQKDIAYINEIIGCKIAISDHRCYNPNKDDLIKLLSQIRVASLVANKPGILNIHMGWGKGNMDVLFEILNETNIPAKHIRPTHITNNERVFEQAVELCKMNTFCDITASKDHEKTAFYINKSKELGIDDNITISSDSNGSCPIWVNNECKGITKSTMSGILGYIIILVKKYNYTLEEAIKYVTVNAAKALNLNNKGSITENYDADVNIINEDLEIDTVISKGKILVKDKKIVKKGYYEE